MFHCTMMVRPSWYDFFMWAWASAELTVYEDGKVAEMIDQLKTLISMNTRTLLK